MGGYVGTNSQSTNAIADIDLAQIDGITQQNSLTDIIDVAANENRVYFGDTTFTGDITVAGQMIVAGGSPNFVGDINITGTLYAY